uniref:Sec-independent protein translocase protein TATC, chloroplastic n=1 Tax=Brassica oleracea var. oleracea TaxID=109376 RepID=A0A0D3AV13_BRAOL
MCSPRTRPYTLSFCNSWKEGGLRHALDENSNDSPTETTPSLGSAVQDRPAVEEDASFEQEDKSSSIYEFLYPDKEELPDDKEMTIFDHLEELRERIFVSVLAVGAAITGCFAFSKDLIVFLETPVKNQGVRFLQLAPGEFFFTTLKVSGYCGILLGSPVILYEIIAFVLPGLTRAERRFLGRLCLVPPCCSTLKGWLNLCGLSTSTLSLC